MSSMKILMKMILVLTLVLGGLTAGAAAGILYGQASKSSTPCCPNFVIHPIYDYYGNMIWPPAEGGYDPYYMYPLYCSCPFLDDAFNRSRNYYLGPSIVINTSGQSTSSSTCSTCSGSESVTIIGDIGDVPDKATIIASKSKPSTSSPLLYPKKLVAV